MSNGGQRFTRKQACPIILKSYKHQRFLETAKADNPVDLSTSLTEPAETAGVEDTKVKLGAKIAVLKVAGGARNWKNTA